MNIGSFKIWLEEAQGEYWGSQGAGILPIATDTGKWLVALRSNQVREPNTWGVIGGKIDLEDTHPEEAAKREFFEETGYSGSIKMTKAYIWASPKKDFIYHNFIGEIQKGNWEPKINKETSRFAWVDYKALVELEPKHFGLSALLKHSGDLIKDISRRYGGA